jgi:uncharacterized repeat protein (TIGR02543 family)
VIIEEGAVRFRQFVFSSFFVVLFFFACGPVSEVVVQEYSISYFANGADSGEAPVDEAKYNVGDQAAIANPGTLALTGHFFTGWNTSAIGDGTSYSAGQVISMGQSSMTLYAQWTDVPTFFITYNGNGSTSGISPMDNNGYPQGSEITVLEPGSMARDGYTFEEWNTTQIGDGTAYQAGSTLVIGDSNINLYAQWSLNPTYSITYFGNENTNGTAPVNSELYENGATITIADVGDLERDGFTFAGWNTTAIGDGKTYAAGATMTMGDADVSLYAQWSLIPTYFVSYHGNGNTGGSSPLDSTAYVTGDSVTVSGAGDLLRDGYTLSGWNTSEAGDGTEYSPGATFLIGSADVHLYAQWDLIPTYNVLYFGNGSTGGSAPVDNQSYENGETVTVASSGTLIRSGYTFSGWNTTAASDGTAYAIGTTLTMASEDVNLYAQWDQLPTYNVFYFGNGSTSGSAPVENTEYYSGDTHTVEGVGSLSRIGHTFEGWNTNSSGNGTDYSPGDTISMGSSDVNLYAQWSELPNSRVLYFGNGNSGGIVPSDTYGYTNGSTVTLAGKSNLYKVGYSFTGWNTAANGSGTTYVPKSTLTMGATDINLYAQWALGEVYPSEDVFSHFTEIGSWEFPSGQQGLGHRVDSDGQYAYVAAQEAGVKIFDIRGSEPTPVSYFVTQFGVSDVLNYGDTLYVAASMGLEVWDVSNKAEPSYIRRISTIRESKRLKLQGTFLAAAEANGEVNLLDLKNPTNPTIRSSYNSGGFNRSMEYSENRIYLAKGSAGILILDASNPDAIAPITGGSYQLPSVTNNAMDVGIDGTTLYVGENTQGLYALDVSDPGNPTLIGQSEASNFSYLQVNNGVVYGPGDQCLNVYEPTGLNSVSPPNILPINQVTLNGGGLPKGMAIVGNSLVAIGQPLGLNLLDISVPTAPVLESSYWFLNSLKGIFLTGNHVYVASGHTDYSGELKVFDISNPAQPSELASFMFPESAESVFIEGNVAYVGGYSQLHTIDISNPANPLLLDTINQSMPSKNLKKVGDLLISANGFEGIQIFNVSDPCNLIELEDFYAFGTVNAIDIYNNYAYLAINNGSNDVIRILDISDPSNIAFVNTVALPGDGLAIAIDGQDLYVSYYTGIQKYDLSTDPENPSLLSTGTLQFTNSDLEIHGGTIYVTDDLNGLKALNKDTLQVVETFSFLGPSYEGVSFDGNLGATTLHGDEKALLIFSID